MTAFAFVAGMLGAWLLYLTSARQIWRVASLAPVWRIVGMVLLLVSAVCWCKAAGAVAGIAAAQTELMLAWVFAPYAGWWTGRRGRHGERP